MFPKRPQVTARLAILAVSLLGEQAHGQASALPFHPPSDPSILPPCRLFTDFHAGTPSRYDTSALSSPWSFVYFVLTRVSGISAHLVSCFLLHILEAMARPAPKEGVVCDSSIPFWDSTASASSSVLPMCVRFGKRIRVCPSWPPFIRRQSSVVSRRSAVVCRLSSHTPVSRKKGKKEGVNKQGCRQTVSCLWPLPLCAQYVGREAQPAMAVASGRQHVRVYKDTRYKIQDTRYPPL